MTTVQKITRLPSLPTIAVEILRIFGDPNASVDQVAKLVQADPAITSKLLKAANSSRFGMAREVSDINQAVALMGRAKVTPIVLSFSLASESMDSPEHTEIFKRCWLRSFVQATAAEILGAAYGAGMASECFTINLLAGTGQLGLLKQDADKYTDCLKRSDAEGSLGEIELSVYGATSYQISIEMMEQTGLPERCIAALMALESSGYRNNPNEEIRRLGDVVSVSEALARYLCDKDSGVALVVLQERFELLKDSGLDIDSLCAEVRRRIDESASLFDIDPSQLPGPEDLLSDAMEQLADFTEQINDNQAVPSELVEENGRLKLQVQQLIKQTSTDALTGVANRGFFDLRLQEVTQQCLRDNAVMGVAVIDIDHFKQVNDTLGHQAGDVILQQVAKTLQHVTRTNETLARYGGEEFAVLTSEATPDGMQILGERMRSGVEQISAEINGQPVRVTISIGIACGIPPNSEFGTELFARADAALYESKHNGRNQVTVDCTGYSRAAIDADEAAVVESTV